MQTMHYIEHEGNMYRIEKDKETYIFLEGKLLKSISEELPDERIKEILTVIAN